MAELGPIPRGWETRTLARLLKRCLVAAALAADLRFLSACGGRLCPLHSSTCRLRVYPPCTGGLRPRPVASCGEAAEDSKAHHLPPGGRHAQSRPAVADTTVSTDPKPSPKGTAMSGDLTTGIPTSTTFELPGYTVEQTLGLAWGLIVRSVGSSPRD